MTTQPENPISAKDMESMMLSVRSDESIPDMVVMSQSYAFKGAKDNPELLAKFEKLKTDGWKVGDSFEHGGRTFTICDVEDLP